MREEVGKAPPELEERKGASECFLAFALLHAGCGDEVIEARLDRRALVCWCLRCDELRIISDPVGRDNDNLGVPTRDLATGELRKGEPFEVVLR
jgi:hypothetical protein